MASFAASVIFVIFLSLNPMNIEGRYHRRNRLQKLMEMCCNTTEETENFKENVIDCFENNFSLPCRISDEEIKVELSKLEISTEKCPKREDMKPIIWKCHQKWRKDRIRKLGNIMQVCCNKSEGTENFKDNVMDCFANNFSLRNKTNINNFRILQCEISREEIKDVLSKLEISSEKCPIGPDMKPIIWKCREKWRKNKLEKLMEVCCNKSEGAGNFKENVMDCFANNFSLPCGISDEEIKYELSLLEISPEKRPNGEDMKPIIWRCREKWRKNKLQRRMEVCCNNSEGTENFKENVIDCFANNFSLPCGISDEEIKVELSKLKISTEKCPTGGDMKPIMWKCHEMWREKRVDKIKECCKNVIETSDKEKKFGDFMKCARNKNQLRKKNLFKNLKEYVVKGNCDEAAKQCEKNMVRWLKKRWGNKELSNSEASTKVII